MAVFGGPSGVLVAKRFGTWKGACRAAGLDVNSFLETAIADGGKASW